MTFIIYTRVSSNPQSDNNHVSFDMQLQACIKYANSNDFNMYAETVSARDMTKQKVLKNILDFANEGDKILVYNVSRFSRDSAKAIEQVKQLTKKSVEIISVTDGLSSLKTRLGFRQKLLEANEESDVLSDRVRGAIQYIRSVNGRIGPPPYGYKNVRKTTDEQGVSYKPLMLAENESEMLIIREIVYRVNCTTDYDEIAENEGIGICNVIAAKLNEQGKLKRGKPWNAWTVKAVYQRFKDTLKDVDALNDADGKACELCHETHSEAGNLMVLCETCEKGFHQNCIHMKRIPKGAFYCGLSCQFQRVATCS